LATKELAVASWQCAVLRFLFSPGNLFTKNNMTVVLTHPTFLFPGLNIKLKGHHFYTTEVIEAASQAVLKWQKRWERCIRLEGDCRSTTNDM
jgi:hypothetical protein